MKILRIRGGMPLEGELVVSGSKNAALPILAATLLIRQPIELIGLPEIGDTHEMLNLLRLRGAFVEHLERGRYRIDTNGVITLGAPHFRDSRLRGSIYLLGAGLAAFGESAVGLPGGCNFGERPIDLHLDAFRALGAEISLENGGIFVKGDRLHAGEIKLSYPSVGATVNAILAACGASGRSVIRGIAREPHVLDLIRFLVCAGAKIYLPDADTAVVWGKEKLRAESYRIIPDMIEAGTYLLAAAATRGAIRLRHAPADQLKSLLPMLSASGCEIAQNRADEIFLRMRKRPDPIIARTEPYPGFPTDLHPPLAAYLLRCKGEGFITEDVFQTRFRYLEGLRRFGGEISLDQNTVKIVGQSELIGARVEAPDLRGAAAYLIASLMAEGESLMLSPDLLYRGYEAPIAKLRRLGLIISDGVV